MKSALKKPSYTKSLLIGCVSVFSAVFPLMLGAAPGFFAHLLYTGGVKRFAPAIIVSMAGSLIVFGTGSLYAQLTILAVAILMSALIQRKAVYFEIALFTAGIITLALFFSVSLMDILEGKPTFTAIQQEFRSIYTATLGFVEQNEAAGLLPAETTRHFAKKGSELVAMLPIYMPATLCSLGAVFGLFNLVIAMKLNRGARADMKPMGRFMLWRLPQSFLYGAFTMVAGMLVVELFGLPSLEAVLYAIMAIITVPFTVQGLSLYVFLMRFRRSGGMLVMLVILLAFFSPDAAIITLAIAGLLEQFFHIRKRIIQGKDKKNS